MTANRGTTGAAWLYTTRDGGHHWSPQPLPPSLANAPVLSFDPVPTDSASVAFSVAEEHARTYSIAVLAARSGHGTWAVGPFLTSHPDGDFHLSFTDTQHGFATDGTSMFVTVDGGATWKSFLPNRSLQGVTQLDFVSQTTGFATAVQDQKSELFLRTNDGGHTWIALP